MIRCTNSHHLVNVSCVNIFNIFKSTYILLNIQYRVHVIHMIKIFIPFTLGITCPPLKPLANGQVIVSGSGLGDTATYKCDDGFILSGGYNVRVCRDSHEWSGDAGVCKRM